MKLTTFSIHSKTIDLWTMWTITLWTQLWLIITNSKTNISKTMSPNYRTKLILPKRKITVCWKANLSLPCIWCIPLNLYFLSFQLWTICMKIKFQFIFFFISIWNKLFVIAHEKWVCFVKNRYFSTDCEEYDEDDDDDGEVHDVNVDVPESLHHMPDVITSECEQHGKSCLITFYELFVRLLLVVCFYLIKQFFPLFENIHYVSLVAFEFNEMFQYSNKVDKISCRNTKRIGI